eukprot:GEMP01043401.1.p1 GENE.GEMP01043401.1~~GEMP01043401.1.p1  ORF type:complete len:346 (+),score=79.36 GEMP01043401.1:152-1189(+)
MVTIFSRYRSCGGLWPLEPTASRAKKKSVTNYLDFIFVPPRADTGWDTRTIMDGILYAMPLLVAKKAAAPFVAMSMVPTGLPVPPTVQQHVPPPDNLLDVLFPKFDWDFFIARVSVLQIIEYLGSVFLGGKTTPTTCGLYLLGASWGPAIATGQLHRLIFPMMLHANGLHIFFNVFFQSRIGFGIEKQFGRRKFMLLYLFCGFFGNLMSVAWDPFKLAVGASTSGFGLVGVWLAEVLLTFHLMGDNRWRVFLWIGMMLGAVVVMSVLAPNVDLIGHMAGMLGGFLIATVLSDMRDEHQPQWYHTFKYWTKQLLFLLVALGLGKVLLLNPHGPLPDCGTLFHPHDI